MQQEPLTAVGVVAFKVDIGYRHTVHGMFISKNYSYIYIYIHIYIYIYAVLVTLISHATNLT